MATNRKLVAMQRRLTLLQANMTRGHKPTVAQISAAYAKMATGNYDSSCWQMLLKLSQQAIGVLDVCRKCGGSGMVSQPFKADPKTGITPKGFQRVPCADYIEGMVVNHTCHGSGKRRIHNPAPGELPGNIGQQQVDLNNRYGTKHLMQQVAAVLNQMAG